MKYSKNNKPIECMMKNSTCYKGTEKMKVKGVLWHSTGANNPNLKRYVQPDDNAKDKASLLSLLGVNTSRNDWNHIDRKAGMNCWIGKLANGEVATVQTMPWNYRPWGCGSGAKGSCNSGWIQFEICEDNLKNKEYFEAVYREAVEITAFLCKKYNLNPHGTVKHNGVNVPVILCHADSYKLGLGNNHGDVLHWFKNFGKTMDDVRNDVADLLYGKPVVNNKVIEWQQAAKKDGLKVIVDGIWKPADAEKAVIRNRSPKFKHKNLTKIVQKAVGVKADGKCGKATEKAIKQYQKANGLEADGMCGLKTWEKILFD
jgi:hypothetical protein